MAGLEKQYSCRISAIHLTTNVVKQNLTDIACIIICKPKIYIISAVSNDVR